MLKDLPPLKSLLAFSATSRCKNFTRAADELCITQSAVSHQIKKLELFLGHKLFYREGNRLLLTNKGIVFSTAVNQAFEQMASATKELTAEQDTVLQFGVTNAFAVHRLTPALSNLNQRYPSLDLRLRMLTNSDSLADLNLDIIVCDKPFEHMSYEYEILKAEAYYPVASPVIAAKLAGLKAENWAEVTRLITQQGFDSASYWHHYYNFELNNHELLYIEHTLLVFQAALNHQGVAILGESLIACELASGTLVKLIDKSMYLDDSGYYFCWHKRCKNDPNINRVKEWLVDLLQSVP